MARLIVDRCQHIHDKPSETANKDSFLSQLFGQERPPVQVT